MCTLSRPTQRITKKTLLYVLIVWCVWKIYAVFDADVQGNLQIKTWYVLLFRFLLKDFLLLTRFLLSSGSLGKRIRIFFTTLVRASLLQFVLFLCSLSLSFFCFLTYICHVVSRPIFFCFHFSLDLLSRYECSIVLLFLFFLQRLSSFLLQRASRS